MPSSCQIPNALVISGMHNGLAFFLCELAGTGTFPDVRMLFQNFTLVTRHYKTSAVTPELSS
jgi:hypothetical protein